MKCLSEHSHCLSFSSKNNLHPTVSSYTPDMYLISLGTSLNSKFASLTCSSAEFAHSVCKARNFLSVYITGTQPINITHALLSTSSPIMMLQTKQQLAVTLKYTISMWVILRVFCIPLVNSDLFYAFYLHLFVKNMSEPL